MKQFNYSIMYGTLKIDYELHLMNRKSLEIVVHPDKRVIVKAPNSSSIESIEEKIRKKARWIKHQIEFFNQFNPTTPERKYVGGESHLYLGRKYRLKIETSDTNFVRLEGSYILIKGTQVDPNHIRNLLDSWYSIRAKENLTTLFNNCWKFFDNGDYCKPTLKLKNMKKRWGSLSNSGQLTLNLNLIRAPVECIEYVIVHELCHLIHYNHGPEFYKYLEHTMPDWKKRKQKLEMIMS